MNPVHPKNHTSLAFMYDTFGNVLPWEDANVMKDNIVLVPAKKSSLKYNSVYWKNYDKKAKSPKVILGADWSACSQKETQEIATIIIDGM